MRINVTLVHQRSGVRGDTSNCMVARAIDELLLPGYAALVGSGSIYIAKYGTITNAYVTPPAVVDRIMAFDNGAVVMPFSFDLPIDRYCKGSGFSLPLKAIFRSAAALVLFMLASIAGATSMVMPTLDTLSKGSDVVAVVEVTSIKSFDDGQSIKTNIDLKVEEAVTGASKGDSVTIQELGGQVGGRSAWVFSNPQYRVGDRVLVFLKQGEDGVLRTNGMGQGVKPTTMVGGKRLAVINGSARSLSTLPRRTMLRTSPLRVARPAVVGKSQDNVEFRMMEPASKWFDNSILVYVDPTGDLLLGKNLSVLGVSASLAAWQSDQGSEIDFASVSYTESPAGFHCEPGKIFVTFNDPLSEITDPVNCSGVLAIGGFCSGDVMDGSTYRRISGGAIVFNNGWQMCGYWSASDPSNHYEVLTHELGHVLGFAHSAESSTTAPTPLQEKATMYWMAHFDGRGPSLTPYETGAAKLVYPVKQPVPAPTPPGAFSGCGKTKVPR